MKKAKWGHQRELNSKYAENFLFLEFVGPGRGRGRGSGIGGI